MKNDCFFEPDKEGFEKQPFLSFFVKLRHSKPFTKWLQIRRRQNQLKEKSSGEETHTGHVCFSTFFLAAGYETLLGASPATGSKVKTNLSPWAGFVCSSCSQTQQSTADQSQMSTPSCSKRCSQLRASPAAGSKVRADPSLWALSAELLHKHKPG